MDKEKLKGNHYCDNINCNHNNTEGLCCMFNPDVCKYRQLQKEYTELEKACDETQELLDKQIEATFKLDKENAELKHTIATLRQEKDNVSMHAKAMEVVAKTKSEQLTKAKEIIKGLLSFVDSLGNFSGGIFAKAEQFLKNDGCPDVMCEDCTKEDCGVKQFLKDSEVEK